MIEMMKMDLFIIISLTCSLTCSLACSLPYSLSFSLSFYSIWAQIIGADIANNGFEYSRTYYEAACKIGEEDEQDERETERETVRELAREQDDERQSWFAWANIICAYL